jgi:acylphosphatase
LSDWIARRCVVSGRVQGVYYRASTRDRARSLGVTGYARNLPDGRVEVLACGPLARVEELCAWLWRGPPAARVDAVAIEEVPADQLPRKPGDFAAR